MERGLNIWLTYDYPSLLRLFLNAMERGVCGIVIQKRIVGVRKSSVLYKQIPRNKKTPSAKSGPSMLHRKSMIN